MRLFAKIDGLVNRDDRPFYFIDTFDIELEPLESVSDLVTVNKNTSNVFYGNSGSIYYIMYVSTQTGYIWDNVNKELLESSSLNNSLISINEVGSTGVFRVITPSDLPVGRYIYVIKDSNGNVIKKGVIEKGDIFGF
jgi:hypothetical protein